MANLHTFEATLNDLEEQLMCVDARLLEGTERNQKLKDKLEKVQEDQAECSAESAQLIRQVAELECQVEDEECLSNIRKDTISKRTDSQGSGTTLRLQVHQSCESFLDWCAAFQEAHKAERLDAQLLELQQHAADVQARLTAAKLAADCVQADTRTASGTAIASEARCKQAAAAQQGLEEKLAAAKDKRTRLQHQLAELQNAQQMRNKENERAACAAALTQEAIAECLSGLNAHKAQKLQHERERSRLRHILDQKEVQLARMKRSMDALREAPNNCQAGRAPSIPHAAGDSMVTGCHVTQPQQQWTPAPRALHQRMSPAPCHASQTGSNGSSRTFRSPEVWPGGKPPQAAAAPFPLAEPAQMQSNVGRQGWPVPAVAALTARPVQPEQRTPQPSLPQAALPSALQLLSHSPAGPASWEQSPGGQMAATPAQNHNQEAKERHRLPYIVTEPDSPQALEGAQGQASKGQAALHAQTPGLTCIFTETSVTRTVTPTKAGCSLQESWWVQELHRHEGKSRQQLGYAVYTAAAEGAAQDMGQTAPAPTTTADRVPQAGTCSSPLDGLAQAPQITSSTNSQGRGRGGRQNGKVKAGTRIPASKNKPRRTLKRLYPDNEEPSPFDWEARRQAEEAAHVAEQDILLSSIWG